MKLERKNVIVTGGLGFIGSAMIRYLINETDCKVLNVDSMTYSSNKSTLKSVESSERYYFEDCDIRNHLGMKNIFKDFSPDVLINFAAETHVDRSIQDPIIFFETNVMGALNLALISKEYKSHKNGDFIFHHISTDEVFGDLDIDEPASIEENLYKPSSPYSASKASADHLLKAFFRTYNLPVIISNCSNNYGPFQHPEKLIPHIIISALSNKTLPIYGNGKQIRDWLYVEDHVSAIISAINFGDPGQSYNIGGNTQITNIEVVKLICGILDKLRPTSHVDSYTELIKFVKDRPGHDKRYAIDSSKINAVCYWKPHYEFGSGLQKTIEWYLENEEWWERIINGSYKLERIGDN
jgi:dTDP-glucose 4,6-dehydratase